MVVTVPSASPRMVLGYARASVGAPPLASQVDTLTTRGVEPRRIYRDESATGVVIGPRPGLDALFDYARPGDAVVVVSIDRLGRTAAEVLATVRMLTDHDVGIQAVREGLSTYDDAGSTLVGVLASLAVANDEAAEARLRVRSTGDRHRAGHRGRPRALTDEQVALAHQMRADGEQVPTIATALGVSRATLYRTLAEKRPTR